MPFLKQPGGIQQDSLNKIRIRYHEPGPRPEPVDKWAPELRSPLREERRHPIDHVMMDARERRGLGLGYDGPVIRRITRYDAPGGPGDALTAEAEGDEVGVVELVVDKAREEREEQ